MCALQVLLRAGTTRSAIGFKCRPMTPIGGPRLPKAREALAATVIFYIAGNNGSIPEGSMNGTSNDMTYLNGVAESVADQLVWVIRTSVAVFGANAM